MPPENLPRPCYPARLSQEQEHLGRPVASSFAVAATSWSTTVSQRVIGIGMIGLGTVGGGVAKLLRDEAALYQRRLGAKLELRSVLVRDVKKARRADLVNSAIITADADAFFAAPGIDIIIEVAGGKGIVSRYARRAIETGRHVITANKALLAAEGAELFALARKHEVAIAFEASCCGGIPVITALQFGLMANRIDALYGILNGTCNYILTEMTRKGKTYATALAEAQAAGFAEADPTLDVSGKDAAQKLAVLASLAFGVRVAEGDVWNEGIDKLDLEDLRFGAELGYDIKLLAIGERVKGQGPGARGKAKGTKARGHEGAKGSAPDTRHPTPETRLSLRVHPSFVHASAPLAQVHGPFNALSVYGHAAGHTMYSGRGAGQLSTASAVVSDILNVASGWYPLAYRGMSLLCDRCEPAASVNPDDLVSRFYLRMNALDVPGVMAKVSEILGAAGISLSAILQHEANVGQFVPLVITTHAARQGALNLALKKIARLNVIHGKPVCIRIVDMPAG